jgi:peroxiredoxin
LQSVRRASEARRFVFIPKHFARNLNMTIKIGDRLPEGTLSEFIEVESEGCALGPNTFKVSDLAKGKKIAIFGLPGAYTPTCSAQHVPGYVKHAAELKAKGVDEIWCISVNDAFVMGAWGRDQKATGTVRMMADGNADFSKALGLDADFSKFGMGTRSQRYSMLVDNGVVKQLNVEQGGKFEVSNAETLLKQLG